MPVPPLADKPINTHSTFCLWDCIKTDAERQYLRSFAPRRWKPPQFRFVSYNIGAMSKPDNGDYKNRLEMAQKPNDRYAEAK